MKVLVACEESQEVCKAFRAKGHEAYSCDIQDCSGGHPEWHIKGDALKILNPKFHESDLSYGIGFFTCDESFHCPELPKKITKSGNLKSICWAESVTKDRAKNRNKTFPGIAKAMAEQWG